MLNDTRIRALALDGMIEKFQDGQIKRVDGQRVISYGLSAVHDGQRWLLVDEQGTVVQRQRLIAGNQ